MVRKQPEKNGRAHSCSYRVSQFHSDHWNIRICGLWKLTLPKHRTSLLILSFMVAIPLNSHYPATIVFCLCAHLFSSQRISLLWIGFYVFLSSRFSNIWHELLWHSLSFRLGMMKLTILTLLLRTSEVNIIQLDFAFVCMSSL